MSTTEGVKSFLESFQIAYKKDKLKVKVIPVSLNKTEKVFHQSQNYYNHMSSREYFGLEIINYSTHLK